MRRLWVLLAIFIAGCSHEDSLSYPTGLIERAELAGVVLKHPMAATLARNDDRFLLVNIKPARVTYQFFAPLSVPSEKLAHELAALGFSEPVKTGRAAYAIAEVRHQIGHRFARSWEGKADIPKALRILKRGSHGWAAVFVDSNAVASDVPSNTRPFDDGRIVQIDANRDITIRGVTTSLQWWAALAYVLVPAALWALLMICRPLIPLGKAGIAAFWVILLLACGSLFGWLEPLFTFSLPALSSWMVHPVPSYGIVVLVPMLILALAACVTFARRDPRVHPDAIRYGQITMYEWLYLPMMLAFSWSGENSPILIAAFGSILSPFVFPQRETIKWSLPMSERAEHLLEVWHVAPFKVFVQESKGVEGENMHNGALILNVPKGLELPQSEVDFLIARGAIRSSFRTTNKQVGLGLLLGVPMGWFMLNLDPINWVSWTVFVAALVVGTLVFLKKNKLPSPPEMDAAAVRLTGDVDGAVDAIERQFNSFDAESKELNQKLFEERLIPLRAMQPSIDLK